MNSQSKLKYRYTVLGVDLALSKSETADYTAIVVAKVFGNLPDRKIVICQHPINKRLTFLETRKEIIQLYNSLKKARHFIKKIYIEEVQYQQSIVEDLRKVEQLPVEGVRPIGEKGDRLASVAHLVQEGKVLFPATGAENLIQQLVGFGVERHDDLVDAFTLVLLKIMEDRSTGFHITTGNYHHIDDPYLSESERKKLMEERYRRLHKLNDEGFFLG